MRDISVKRVVQRLCRFVPLAVDPPSRQSSSMISQVTSMDPITEARQVHSVGSFSLSSESFDPSLNHKATCSAGRCLSRSLLKMLQFITRQLAARNCKGCIPIAIRVRFEHSMLQHATRFFVRSHTSPIRAPYENRVEACHTVD